MGYPPVYGNTYGIDVSDSLIIADQIELIGSAVSTIPACAGAVFLLQPGYDLGAPQPTTDIVSSLLLDGERPFGRRASNRTITLPIEIQAPDFQTMMAAREVLLQAVDAQAWTLTWTRDPAGVNAGGLGVALPLILDCFRAQPTIVQWGGQDGLGRFPIGLVTLTFQAMPYGRSDTPVSLAVASPLPGGTSPPSPVVIDNYSSVVAGQNFQSSTKCVVGPNSARFNPCIAPISDCTGHAGTPASYLSASFAGKDITGRQNLTLWAGVGSDYYSTWNRGPVVFSCTLTDNLSRTLSFSVTRTIQASNSSASPNWQTVTIPIPQGVSSFSYSNVTRYQLSATNRGTNGFRYAQIYFDALTAISQSKQSVATVRGAMYTLLGINGSARAPVSLQFQQAPGTGTATTLTLPGPVGTPQTFTVPTGVTSLNVRCVGPGGRGGNATANLGAGGGGGGGEDAQETALAVTAGNSYSYTIGAGSSGQSTTFTGDSVTVTAHAGGNGGDVTNGSGTGGTGGTGSTNSVHHNGGAGGAGTAGAACGGGGGSGGTSLAGNAASGATGGAAVTGGGAGATGTTHSANGAAGGQPGGGGAGAGSGGATQTGGKGGDGQIQVTYSTASAPFSTLIAHRPGPDAPQNLNPLVMLGPFDTPNGGTEYAVPSLVSGTYADFNGTYSVVAVANGAFNTPGSSRTLTVTVKQYEYIGGPAYSTSVSRIFTPSTDITNGIVVLGELTLPLKDAAPDNSSGFYTITINDTNTSDLYLDVMFLDTTGQTAVINVPAAGAYYSYFIDEPGAERDLGRVLGSTYDRSQAISVLDQALVSGGPISVDPGDNLMLCYCVEGAPALAVTYSPRWWLDRLT